jgi:hypothetical protein
MQSARRQQNKLRFEQGAIIATTTPLLRPAEALRSKHIPTESQKSDTRQSVNELIVTSVFH